MPSLRAILLPVALLLSAAALAQPGPGLLGSATELRPPPEPPRERPPGLPGLQARPSVVIPPQQPPGAMNPNDALFDAIARGDVPAAREAVRRGADTNARNALGLTPLESAVDHGRPEMIFYLLSLRGTAGNPPPPAEADPRPRRARAEASPPAAPARPTTAEAPAAAAHSAPALRPQLWANDGGAPRPEVGFLGFDAGRPGGAAPRPPRS
ncbi:MAG: ankyrin repeat domain-containing protein [Rhodovarius sp.]|nr:ankyrin repeat domain-containing protein [Rhodovarius sp.]